MNTVRALFRKKLCLGCGLCEALALGNARMREGEDGFLRPVFQRDLQKTERRTLRKVCPALHVECHGGNKGRAAIWGTVCSAALAWSAEKEVRHKASSGGVASALALFLLETGRVDGILHVGVEKGSYLENRLMVSRTREEVLARAASRYAPADIFSRLPQILEERPGEKYAFVGKPCDMAGMRNFLALHPCHAPRIYCLISIFCAGMPSLRATRRAVASFGRKEEPCALRYRGEGWPGAFCATYADGSEGRMSYDDSWGKILGRDLGLRCKICPDGVGLLSDIALGDAWNTKDGYPDFTEDEGRNFCLIRTPRGDDLMRSAAEAGYLVSEPLAREQIASMQPYQYDRRRVAGLRILAVRLLLPGALRMKGLGLLKAAATTPLPRAAREFLGTIRRFVRI